MRQRRSLLGLHLAYNFGRTITYMLLGAIAGLAGGTMGFFGRLAGFENIAAIVAGVAMVLAALTLFGFHRSSNPGAGLHFLADFCVRLESSCRPLKLAASFSSAC